MSIETFTTMNISIQGNHFSFSESVGRELMEELQEHFKDSVKVWTPEPFEAPHPVPFGPIPPVTCAAQEKHPNMLDRGLSQAKPDQEFKARVDVDSVKGQLDVLRKIPNKPNQVDETV